MKKNLFMTLLILVFCTGIGVSQAGVDFLMEFKPGALLFSPDLDGLLQRLPAESLLRRRGWLWQCSGQPGDLCHGRWPGPIPPGQLRWSQQHLVQPGRADHRAGGYLDQSTGDDGWKAGGHSRGPRVRITCKVFSVVSISSVPFLTHFVYSLSVSKSLCV